jgi:hypothetical protein
MIADEVEDDADDKQNFLKDVAERLDGAPRKNLEVMREGRKRRRIAKNPVIRGGKRKGAAQVA